MELFLLVNRKPRIRVIFPLVTKLPPRGGMAGKTAARRGLRSEC